MLFRSDGSTKTNKVCVIPLIRKLTNKISAPVNTAKNTRELSVSLRVKPAEAFESALPDSNQMSLDLVYSDGSTHRYSCEINPNGQWQQIQHTFSFNALKVRSLSILILPGNGSVWVADVVAKRHQLAKLNEAVTNQNQPR